MGTVRRVAAFAAVAGVAGALLVAMPLVSEAAGNKSHDLKATTSAGAASSVEAGAASATVVVTIKNTSTSGNITANAARVYPVFGTSATVVNAVSDSGSLTPFATTLAADTPYLEVTNANVRRNAELKITLTVRVSCAATTGQLLTFTSDVRQSNDFNPNNVSNQLPYMEDDGVLPRTTVSSPCKLAFTGQPNHARPGDVITQSQFNTGGGAVQVTVQTNSGTTVAWESRNVTVAATLLPSTAKTLGGTSTVAAVSGVATFNNLTLADVGSYKLTASATNYSGATKDSNTFYIFNANCFDEDLACQISVIDGANNAGITVNDDPNNELIAELTANFATGSLDCPGYEEFGKELNFDIDVFTPAGQTPIDLTNLSKDLVVTKPVPDAWAAAHGTEDYDFQVCFRSPYEFRAIPAYSTNAQVNYDHLLEIISGGPLLETPLPSGGFYQGLLPRCSVLLIDSPTDGNGPCIESVEYDEEAKTVTITAKVHADDPTWK